MWGADGQENISHREWLIMFDRVVKEVKAEMEQKGQGGGFIGAKVCYLMENAVGVAKSTRKDHL